MKKVIYLGSYAVVMIALTAMVSSCKKEVLEPDTPSSNPNSTDSTYVEDNTNTGGGNTWTDTTNNSGNNNGSNNGNNTGSDSTNVGGGNTWTDTTDTNGGNGDTNGDGGSGDPTDIDSMGIGFSPILNLELNNSNI